MPVDEPARGSAPAPSPMPPRHPTGSHPAIVLDAPTMRERYPGWRPADHDHSEIAIAWRAERGVRLGEENRDAISGLRGALDAWGKRWDDASAAASERWDAVKRAAKWTALVVCGLLLARYVPRVVDWIASLHH